MNKEIIPILIENIITASYTHLAGKDKKKNVINNISKITKINPETLEFLSELIDVLISVDKGKLKLNPGLSKGLKFCCS